MPDLKVVCPSCSTVLELPNASQLGSKTRCPKCRGVVPIPTTDIVKKAKKAGPPSVAKPGPKASSPKLLIGLATLFVLVGGVAVGGYFVRTWYRPLPGGRLNPDKSATTGGPLRPTGFQTPDAVLDAYAKVLRDGDVAACKATMTRERLKHDEDYISGQLKNPAAPGAMEKGWINLNKHYLAAEWKEGEYKRFPVEFEGPDNAIIVCVYQNKGKGLKDNWRKYVFVRQGRGFLQSDWANGDAKELDPNKYPYTWEKPKPADKPEAGPVQPN